MADKPKYKSKEISQLDPTDDKTVWTPKLDGAHTIINMREGKLPRLFSHRVSTITGNLIEYTPKLPHIKTPAKVEAIVRGETLAIGPNGKAVPPTTVTSILNSNVSKSLALQESQQLKTVTALIDLITFDGKSGRSMSYEKKREILEDIAKKHKDFFVPPIARTYEEKTKLLNEIISGEHPLTCEGIIEHDLKEKGMPFTKAKVTNDHDVFVRKIFKEEETKPGRAPMAGGFWYSWDMDGPIVGKVGTGFSHILKSKLLSQPEKYIGRVAKVKAVDISKNKALIKPSFVDWHVEKNISDDGWAKQTIIVPRELAADRKSAEAIARQHADRIYTSRETESSFRFRQRHPDRFDSSTFRYWKHPSGVGIIFGKLKEDGIEKKSAAYERGCSDALAKIAAELGRREFEADFELGKKKKGQNPEDPDLEQPKDSTAPYAEKHKVVPMLRHKLRGEEKTAKARWLKELPHLSPESKRRLVRSRWEHYKKFVQRAQDIKTQLELLPPNGATVHQRRNLLGRLQWVNRSRLRPRYEQFSSSVADASKFLRGVKA